MMIMMMITCHFRQKNFTNTQHRSIPLIENLCYFIHQQSQQECSAKPRGNIYHKLGECLVANHFGCLSCAFTFTHRFLERRSCLLPRRSNFVHLNSESKAEGGGRGAKVQWIWAQHWSSLGPNFPQFQGSLSDLIFGMDLI